MPVIHNFELERLCLSGLLKYPDLYVKVEAVVTDSDFVSKLNRIVYAAIKSFLSVGAELNDILLAEKIKNLNITFSESDLSPMEYLESLRLISLTELAAIEGFKQLKKTTVRRELSEMAGRMQTRMLALKDAGISDILKEADAIFSEKIAGFESSTEEFVDIFSSIEQKIEERGENPVEEIGFMGPFPKTNELYGSLLRDGAITVLGARTGVGKTAAGMFYMTHVADKYDVPVLHLDQGEMSIEELQYRAVSMMTNGQVSYDALEHGYWRKNKETTALVRSVWPRVKKLKMYYQDVSRMSPTEILWFIKRFYLAKIGRGNKFLTHYDYLKAFDLEDARGEEWQVMGKFLKDVKNLYKNELNNPFWTSVQLNRGGIVGNKNAATVDDTENVFGVSDRITQQATHALLLRPKMNEEIAAENGRYGTVKGVFVKHRHLGRNAQAALTPVKTPNNTLVKNFLHFKVTSFHIEEMGDFATTVRQSATAPFKSAKPAQDHDNDTLTDDSLDDRLED
jgi:replicative DNA helicase